MPIVYLFAHYGIYMRGVNNHLLSFAGRPLPAPAKAIFAAPAPGLGPLSTDEVRRTMAVPVVVNALPASEVVFPPLGSPPSSQVDPAANVHVMYDTAYAALPSAQRFALDSALDTGATRLVLISTPATDSQALTDIVRSATNLPS